MLLLTGSQRGLMKMNITIIDIRKKNYIKLLYLYIWILNIFNLININNNIICISFSFG